MPSTFRSEAMSSQGTAVYVSQLTGGVAVTVSGITQASPGVVTATAHGMFSGDVGVFAAVGGMVELNGETGIVSEPADDSFEIYNTDTTSFTTYTTGGTFTPYPMLQACEIKDLAINGGQAAEIDVTTMCSTAKEYRMGLQDAGEATMNINFVPWDPALAELMAAKRDGLPRWFKVVMPQAAGVLVFQAYVRQVSLSFGVDQAIQGSVGLRLTGDVEMIDIVEPVALALAA